METKVKIYVFKTASTHTNVLAIAYPDNDFVNIMTVNMDDSTFIFGEKLIKEDNIVYRSRTSNILYHKDYNLTHDGILYDKGKDTYLKIQSPLGFGDTILKQIKINSNDKLMKGYYMIFKQLFYNRIIGLDEESKDISFELFCNNFNINLDKFNKDFIGILEYIADQFSKEFFESDETKDDIHIIKINSLEELEKYIESKLGKK